MRMTMALAAVVCALVGPQAFAQEQQPPRIRAGALHSAVAIDGALDEAAWNAAELVDAFVQTVRLDEQLHHVPPPLALPAIARRLIRKSSESGETNLR